MQEQLTETQYVETPERLAALIETIRRSPVVVIDTEFIPESTYEPRLCLIQLATPAEGVAIVDPITLPDLRDLWMALTEPGRELVALGARQEIIFCIRGANRPPAKLVDLQVAAGLIGYTYPLSQTKMIQQVVGVQIKGGEAFTDWRKRPLSPSQLRYASEDVRYLLTARDRIMSEATRMGRVDWIDAECRRHLERVVASDSEEAWRRISGSSGLDEREAAVMRELWLWRDRVARENDRPARRVLPDHLLVGLARRKPSRVEDLHALRGMERVGFRKAAQDILAAVEKGLKLPETDCPRVKHRSDPPQVAMLAQLLAAVVQVLAAQHKVDSTLLATSADLQDLVRSRLGLLEKGVTPMVMEGWRGKIAGQQLLEVIEGKRAIRVSDVRSKHPLSFDGK